MSGSGDGFLIRWSRRKAGLGDPADPVAESEVAPALAPEAPRVVGPDQPTAGVDSGPAPATSLADVAPSPTMDDVSAPTMNDVSALTRSSDYSRFVQPGVEPGVRNAAMKKLFSDPHFNVMDGLDTYIDDYGKADPIPPSMLRLMNQAASLRLFDDDPAAPVEPVMQNGESPPPALACPDGEGPASMAQSDPNPSTLPHPAAPPFPDDDPDLRLQPDDAPGRRGPEPGPRA